MPRFNVIEKRAYRDAVLIDAVDAEAAQQLQGDIIDSICTDSWADELISCEEVPDDQESASTTE